MILIDTHVLLWHERGDQRLGQRAREEIGRSWSENEAAVSAISFWEVGMQIRKDRLGFHLDLDAWRRDLLRLGLVEIPVDGAIAARAGLLHDIHGDPADRLIVATALEGHRLVTADRGILAWPGRLSRLRATD